MFIQSIHYTYYITKKSRNKKQISNWKFSTFFLDKTKSIVYTYRNNFLFQKWCWRKV